MKMSMGRKWKRLSFTTKLMVVNSIAILVVVLIVTLSQTRMFVKASEEVGISNLSMLTNQVCLNFQENQKNITDAIYARSVTFQIPSFMKKYQEKKDELHTAVAQMVTHSTEYDYVMLEMADGTRIDSGAKYTERIFFPTKKSSLARFPFQGALKRMAGQKAAILFYLSGANFS